MASSRMNTAEGAYHSKMTLPESIWSFFAINAMHQELRRTHLRKQKICERETSKFVHSTAHAIFKLASGILLLKWVRVWLIWRIASFFYGLSVNANYRRLRYLLFPRKNAYVLYEHIIPPQYVCRRVCGGVGVQAKQAKPPVTYLQTLN